MVQRASMAVKFKFFNILRAPTLVEPFRYESNTSLYHNR